MRLLACLGAFCVACGAARPLATAHQAECNAAPSLAARPFTPRQLPELVGDFILTMVDTVSAEPLPVTRDTLHLYVPGPSFRYRYAYLGGDSARLESPLAGWLITTGGNAAWQAMVGSRDTMHPGVAFERDRLRIGDLGLVLDGVGENLQITHVSESGFWGRWSARLGLGVVIGPDGRELPDPAGYFCAIRDSDA